MIFRVVRLKLDVGLITLIITSDYYFYHKIDIKELENVMLCYQIFYSTN